MAGKEDREVLSAGLHGQSLKGQMSGWELADRDLGGNQMQQEIVEKLQVLSTGESTVLMPRVPHFVRMVSQKLVRKYLVWETVSHTGARVRVSGYLS